MCLLFSLSSEVLSAFSFNIEQYITKAKQFSFYTRVILKWTTRPAGIISDRAAEILSAAQLSQKHSLSLLSPLQTFFIICVTLS